MGFSQPNVILITADDLGLQLGCYGDETINTINIDSFSKEAILFSNAYSATSSCSPSRASMLTGLYPHEHGQVGLVEYDFSISTKENIITTLANNGYYTGLIGKLHIDPSPLFHFDYVGVHYLDTRKISSINFAMDSFLDLKDGKPFFLMLNFFDPHRSFIDQVEGVPSTVLTSEDVSGFDFQGRMESAELLQDIAGYYNEVARIDILFKKVIDILKDKGLYENTIIIFTSDHGPPFNRGKLSLYEAGIKVPLIIKIPNTTAATIKTPVSLVDLVPTIADLVDVKLDFYTTGNSIVPLLEEGKYSKDRELFSEFNHHARPSYFRRALRIGDYKLIQNLEYEKQNPYIVTDNYSLNISKQIPYKNTIIDSVFVRFKSPPEFELYDVENDPYEFHDIYTKEQNEPIVEKLKRKLLEWQISTSDSLSFNGETKFIKPSTSFVDFGIIPVNETINSNLTVTNNGSFYSLLKGSKTPQQYAVTFNNSNDTIKVGDIVEVSVEYTPKSKGIFYDTLDFLSNSDTRQYVILKSVAIDNDFVTVLKIAEREIVFHLNSYPGEFNVLVHDLTGKLVFEKLNINEATDNLYQIGTSNSLNGVLIIRILNQSFQRTVKVFR
jgi:N-sulfoglucosamine sulfohydrolase